MGVLVVVSGRPGSGRTYASRFAAGALSAPAFDAGELAGVYDDAAPAPAYGPGRRAHLGVLALALAHAGRGAAVVDAPFAPDVFTADDWDCLDVRADAGGVVVARVHLLCRPEVARARLAAGGRPAAAAVLDDFDRHAAYWGDVDLGSPARIVADNSEGIVDLAETVARLLPGWGAPTLS